MAAWLPWLPAPLPSRPTRCRRGSSPSAGRPRVLPRQDRDVDGGAGIRLCRAWISCSSSLGWACRSSASGRSASATSSAGRSPEWDGLLIRLLPAFGALEAGRPHARAAPTLLPTRRSRSASRTAQQARGVQVEVSAYSAEAYAARFHPRRRPADRRCKRRIASAVTQRRGWCRPPVAVVRGM
jgi:hypothetical protein